MLQIKNRGFKKIYMYGGSGLFTPIANLASRLIMLRLHYVPGGHGSPVSPKRNAPWNFGNFSLCIQVLLGLDTFSHGQSRYP